MHDSALKVLAKADIGQTISVNCTIVPFLPGERDNRREPKRASGESEHRACQESEEVDRSGFNFFSIRRELPGQEKRKLTGGSCPARRKGS